LPRSDANPDGADRAVFDDFLVELALDRPVAIKTYLDRYYNIDLLGGSRVSDQAWQNSFHVAIQVSAAWPRAVRPHGRKTSGPMLPASPSRS
jgi:non-heme chloroperoxidase